MKFVIIFYIIESINVVKVLGSMVVKEGIEKLGCSHNKQDGVDGNFCFIALFAH
jgi:hypothetical protein